MTTSVNWPSWMPLGTIEGYSYSRKELVLRTELETGRTRMRRRYSDGPALVNISWAFESLQFAFFEGWFLNTIKAGAVPFNMNLNVGLGCSMHECRFAGPYTMQRLDRPDLYRVTAALEATKLNVLDADTIAVIDLYSSLGMYEELLAFYDLLEIHVNIELPDSEMGYDETEFDYRLWGEGQDDIRVSSDETEPRVWRN